jgi:hypothetical protein
VDRNRRRHGPVVVAGPVAAELMTRRSIVRNSKTMSQPKLGGRYTTRNIELTVTTKTDKLNGGRVGKNAKGWQKPVRIIG